jgi:hypothetical protein
MSAADELGSELLGVDYWWEHAPVRACESAVGGIGEDSASHIRAGPVQFLYARENADVATEDLEPIDGRYRAIKLGVAVDAGERALVVRLPESGPRSGLMWSIRQPMESYAEAITDDLYPLWVGEPAVVFEACDEFTTSFDRGLLVAGPQCVELEVHLMGRERAWRASLPFGVDACP